MNVRESFENDYPLHPSTMFNGLAYIVDLPFILDANFPPETGAMIAIIQQARWEAWQASRAAIVLPESTGGYIAGEYGNGYADALHEVKQAIGVDVP